jgi:tuberous sclerosis 2
MCLIRNQDGTPFILPVTHSPAAPSPFLRSLSSLLSRGHSTPTNPALSTILIYIADHLTDADTANLPQIIGEQQGLSPTSPNWLDNWHSLMGNRTLVSVHRPITRCCIMEAVENVYESVREMQLYRRPLADMVYEFCTQWVGEEGLEGEGEAMWRILGHEVVLRTVESVEEDDSISCFIDLIVVAASESEIELEEDNGDTASVATADTHSPSPSTFTAPSTIVSPILSRTQSEHHTQAKEKDKESGLPSVMSILSSLTTATSSRSHSTQPPPALDEASGESVIPLPPPENSSLPRVVAAVSSLITIFTHLAFTPFALEAKNIALAVHIFEILLGIVTTGGSTQARLTALQFLMHLRAHRDHRLYFTHDAGSHVMMLSSLINRSSSPEPEREVEEHYLGDAVSELRKGRPRVPQESDGRQRSRGRGAVVPSRSTTSRSQSRTTTHALPSTPTSGSHTPLWHVPEVLPFPIAEVGPSECLISYAEDPARSHVLPVSSYLSAITGILEGEKNWEILSYVLCHLPVQLANKHLFCGPKSREIISKMLSVLCGGILSSELAFYVDRWPHGLKARDAQGLAYHTLSVLVSYRRCLDLKQCHLLVEVFQTGLNGQLSTIKCCLHALSLSAFELQSSITKCLPRILEMLSQIMSNPNMAVHILGFLSIIGSLPPLYANFTEGDFKMVFGVALQYLQHYTRLDASPTTSWALSQHVRILSYTVVYVWFLAVKLQDRPRHISYITRQLLLANEGKENVDDPTEVCFDWLARYTYASADPRPAHSVFSDIVMNPHSQRSTQDVLAEKTWVRGHSVITIRAVSRRGWIEVLCRRPSGFTRFLCRTENAPMVKPGDVDPDLISVPASLILERDPLEVRSAGQEGAVESPPPPEDDHVCHTFFTVPVCDDIDDDCFHRKTISVVFLVPTMTETLIRLVPTLSQDTCGAAQPLPSDEKK